MPSWSFDKPRVEGFEALCYANGITCPTLFPDELAICLARGAVPAYRQSILRRVRASTRCVSTWLETELRHAQGKAQS
jgi:hypothetical protein